NHSFSSMASMSGGNRALTSESGVAENLRAPQVSVSYFDLLGVAPIAGRTFVAEDGKPGSRVVVLNGTGWRSRLGGEPGLSGTAIQLDGRPFTVIGVVPARAQLLYTADVWTPFIPSRGPEQRKPHYLVVYGRLKPGVTIEQARADMAVVAQGIAKISPET